MSLNVQYVTSAAGGSKTENIRNNIKITQKTFAECFMEGQEKPGEPLLS